RLPQSCVGLFAAWLTPFPKAPSPSGGSLYLSAAKVHVAVSERVPGPFEPDTLLTYRCCLLTRAIRAIGTAAIGRRIGDHRSRGERRRARGQQHDGCDQLLHFLIPLIELI